MTTLWVVFCVVLELIQVSSGLQWTSSTDLPNNFTVATCAGQDVTLAWDYNVTHDEQVVDIEWMFTPRHESAQQLIATSVRGHFFTEESASHLSIQYIPGAGIRLLHVTPAYSGTYSVYINTHNSVTSFVQSVVVTVTAEPQTTTGQLTARFHGARYLDSTQQHELILSCGVFEPLWLPFVGVVWTTPDGHTLPSSFVENNEFVLALPNPFVSGQYTCRIDSSSPAFVCITGNTSLTRGATVTLNETEGKIALKDSELGRMHSELLNVTDALAAYVVAHPTSKTTIERNGLRLYNGVNLLNGNVVMGPLEIFINGVWGSVCDAGWNNDDLKRKFATVACRQMGLPYGGALAYPSAYFGQGTGPVHLSHVICSGTESRLLDCSHDAIDPGTCTHYNDAGVVCA